MPTVDFWNLGTALLKVQLSNGSVRQWKNRIKETGWSYYVSEWNRPTLSPSHGSFQGTQTESWVSIPPVKELIGKLNLTLNFKIGDTSYSLVLMSTSWS